MRLTRSRDDVLVSGVLAGLGDYFNVDLTLLRIGFVVLGFVCIGALITLYIIGAVIIPKDHKENERERREFDRRIRRSTRGRREDRRFESPECPDYKETSNKK